MNWPLILGLAVAWIIFPPLALCAINRRTAFGDSADNTQCDLSDQRNLGVGGGADHFFHDQPNSRREPYDHA